MNTSTTRRSFLKSAALASIGMPTIIPGSALGKNGRLPQQPHCLGRHRCWAAGFNLDGFYGRRIPSSSPSPIHRKTARAIKRKADEHYGNKDCVIYDDMSGVLERDDIYAVLITTGDRWHATASIYAARAGKDIYCEKPCAMNIQECQELDDAMKKHQRVFQAGTQRRSVPNFKLAADLALTGRLADEGGHAGILQLQNYLDPARQPEPDPAIINWDKWLGPAPDTANEAIAGVVGQPQGLYSAWRLPSGDHTIDLCQWATDADGTTPIKFSRIRQPAATYQRHQAGHAAFLWQSVGDWIKGLGTCPVRFVGDEGWVEAGDHLGIESSHPRLLKDKLQNQIRGTDPVLHVRNFLDCVKTREQPVCNSTAVRYGHMACFAAAISWKLGRKVTFDPKKEEFVNDAEANRLRTYRRRAPYTI